MKARKYKGYEIRIWSGPCGQTPDSGEPKYFIQIQHSPSDMDWSAENCPQFWSLKSAKEWISEKINGNKVGSFALEGDQ